MVRNWMKVSTVPVLAAALWVAGCTDQSAPSDRLVGPDVVSLSKDKVAKADKGKKIKVKKKDGSTADFTLVQTKPVGKDVITVDRKAIGPEGGILSVGGHSLLVPAGAVRQRTMFSMKLYRKVLDEGDPTTSADDQLGLGVELHAAAYDCNRDGRPEKAKAGAGCREFDIGEAGFGDTGVYLTLSYTAASNITTQSPGESLFIVWLKRNGEGEAFGTGPGQIPNTATARLDHFSDYLLAMP